MTPPFEAIVHGQLRARLLTVSAQLPKLRQWQGHVFDEPDTGVEWLREAMLVDSAPSATSLGNVARVVLRGDYQIDLFGPTRKKGTLITRAGLLRETFPRSLQLGGEGVTVDLPSVTIPHGLEDRPGRWHQPVSIQWIARTFL